MKHHGEAKGKVRMEKQFQYLVGIDGATESHEGCVLDSARQILASKQIEHSGSGIKITRSRY